MIPKGYKALRPLHPNFGIEAKYRRSLEQLVQEMSDSYEFWLIRRYRANRPEMAQDALSWTPKRVTARQADVSGERTRWHAYVDGKQLVDRDGVARVFRSQAAAEAAGLRYAGPSGMLTQPQEFGEASWRTPIDELELQPLPAQDLAAELERLRMQWGTKIEQTAPKLARWFADATEARSTAGMRKILRDGGLTVRFQMTPAMRDILEATVHENVSLIRSIGSQYHDQVAGLVMRSVTAGRDLGPLTAELEHRFGVTHRRAALIAKDQGNKATAMMGRARQQEAGLEEAIWLHSHGGKEPRPTHLANSGKRYKISEGWLDPAVGRHIWPGTEINCRCVAKPIVKGFS